MKKKLKDNGFIFLKINPELEKEIYTLQKKLKKLEKNLLTVNDEIFFSKIMLFQKNLNKKFKPVKFMKYYSESLKKIFNNNFFGVQSYFYLRAVRPNRKSKFQPINFHRESFQGPKFFKDIYNIWIPLLNCNNYNALKYYPKSHKYKLGSDFKIIERKTNVMQGSNQHKNGLLYKDRKIIFDNKKISKKLFKKKNLILFSGELIHGNGSNFDNKIRFSIDARMILKKKISKNPIQSATGKKYFNITRV